VKKTGEVIWINLTASIILGPDSEPIHGLAMVEDITEIKRTQEEAFVRHKLESVGTLAGGIAHDFNNLLGGVLAQADAAFEELEGGLSPREGLNTIRQLAIHGSDIVRQLMIYAGKENEGAGAVDLSQTVAEMAELLKVSVSKHSELVTDLGQDLPAVQADAAQIRRVVMNLVSNASQAIGDRDGVIRVTTRRVAGVGPAALSKTSSTGDYLELEVSDTGCGMPQEMQVKVFDPFFTTRSAGHGLGLAVVQGIVRNLGGTIRLASEPGRGTTFRVLLPCVPARAEETANFGITPQSLREPLAVTVLVVEDEDELRQAVAKVVRRRGAVVLEAANGSAAIDLLREHCDDIDIVLLDLTIPGASSQEVLAEAARARPDLKVILTSAYSEEVAAASMCAPNTRGFIRKPFPLEDLVKTLYKTLSS
jgi:signal transduction histidine kinase